MKQTTPSWSDIELREALFSFQDLMDRLPCPFFPLRHTAQEVYDESQLTGEIYAGILASEWTDQRQSIFNLLLDNMHIPYEETPRGFKLILKGINIYVTIIRGSYAFFKRPEIRFFGVTEFLIPNPISEYMKIKQLVR